MDKKFIQQITNAADGLCEAYDKIGVRVQDEPFSFGPILHRSHVWTNGDDTGVQLDGVCAQDVTTLTLYHNHYLGDHIAIVAGNDYQYGDDPGEIIFRDAVVVCIIS